ncbi:hypothetical protein CCACVL1_09121 [Corchorus capsularis]|uniref:non-specific serine/threonine protein kinase n=1 Tax=Corchorus capsularis TaxID=210143 RepID=A0A1R3IXS0_COCAP|nr:hypothetical protein CCACVL1_09121 [Corchorus capsularis]
MKGEEWIEDVRREVKILKALSGHKHLVRFYDACEDDKHVYIVMEFCEGGTLGNRLSARKTRCTEEEAKAVIIQILSLVSFCHLQGVVHCDLKPENIIFTSAGEDADIKLIDFGISNFYRPGKSLDDPAGTALFMAPEVLQKSYGLEVDMWSIGVITYYLLGGRWPFWASTKSGIRRSVQSSNPNFDDEPWPSVSPEAKDFVKRLLSKNCLNRMSAVQALTHRWLRDKSPQIPLDIYIFRIVTGYLHTKPLRCAVRKAISKALPEDELVYLKAQFRLLEPNGDGSVSLENFKMALARNATPLMDESSWAPYILRGMEALKNRRMYFEEFCAAAISISSLEAVEGWEQITSTAFEYFEQEGNRVFSEQELCQELRIKGPSALSYVKDFIRNSDGKLNFLGFRKLLERPKPPQSKCGRKKKAS